MAIVESLLLVYCRLDYIIYNIRDFKIQRHIGNKNIAWKVNYFVFFESYTITSTNLL